MKCRSLLAVIVVIVILFVVGVHYFLGERAQQKREDAYQSALRSYSERFQARHYPQRGGGLFPSEKHWAPANVLHRSKEYVKERLGRSYEDRRRGRSLGFAVRKMSMLLSNLSMQNELGRRWVPLLRTLKTISIYRWLEGCL
jgi:hypothetical protein